MTRIDWDQMLAGLEQQRTGLAQEIADVDAVIETIRRRSAPKVRVAELAKPRSTNGRTKPAAKPPTKPAVQSGKLSADQVVRMGELYEAGKPADEIATRFKITTALVYYYVKSRKWKRPKEGAAAPAAAAPSKQPAGTQLSGSVRCTSPDCGSWTDFDPCRACGKPLKRNKW